MKFRIDFVTNSSSTGYVAVNIETKQGKISCYEDYDTGFGGIIYNNVRAETIREKMDEVSSGEQLYDALVYCVDGFEYFDKESAEKIKHIKNRDDLISISLNEHTSFDEGPSHDYNFEYDFEGNRVTKYDEEDVYRHSVLSKSEVKAFVDNALKMYGEEFFLDLHEFYLDGHEGNIWDSDDIDRCWSTEEKAELIKCFNDNGIHYDSGDKYVSSLHGSSNDKIKLIDKKALVEAIMENDDAQQSFIRRYDDYLLDHVYDYYSSLEEYHEKQAEEDAEIWMEQYGKYIEKNPVIKINGSIFVFSGLAAHWEEDEHPTVHKIIEKGGQYRSKVSGLTDYLVVNPGEAGQSKIDAAIEQQKKGKGIKVVLLEDLEKVLNGESFSNGEIDADQLLGMLELEDALEDAQNQLSNLADSLEKASEYIDKHEQVEKEREERWEKERQDAIAQGKSYDDHCCMYVVLENEKDFDEPNYSPEDFVDKYESFFLAYDKDELIALMQEVRRNSCSVGSCEEYETDFRNLSIEKRFEFATNAYLSLIPNADFDLDMAAQLAILKSRKWFSDDECEEVKKLMDNTLNEIRDGIDEQLKDLIEGYNDYEKIKDRLFVKIDDIKDHTIIDNSKCFQIITEGFFFEVCLKLTDDATVSIDIMDILAWYWHKTPEEIWDYADNNEVVDKRETDNKEYDLADTLRVRIQAINDASDVYNGFLDKIECFLEAESYTVTLMGDYEVDSLGYLVAYNGCEESIVLPEGVIAIDPDAFLNYKEFVSVVFPEGFETICNYAFYKCNLESIEIPNSVTGIGNGAFSHCESLKKVVIPNSVTEIEMNTFFACTSLASIKIPDSVTRIGDSAFQGCTGLTSIEIPDSVTKFDINVFLGCDNVTVYCSSNSEAAKYCEKNGIKFVSTDITDEEKVTKYKCPKCGNLVVEGCSSCENCGTPFNWGAPAQTQVPQKPRYKCPTCGGLIEEGTPACPTCGQIFKW